MIQGKTTYQWAKHIKDNYLNSNFRDSMVLDDFDYNMTHLMDMDPEGNFVVSPEFVSNIKLSLGIPDSCENSKLNTLYIDGEPVMALKIHPNLVNGDSYNIIVNPRETVSDCVYVCRHVISY
jgi:hypothetical protein